MMGKRLGFRKKILVMKKITMVELLSERQLTIPKNQHSYFWETDLLNASSDKQVNLFLKQFENNLAQNCKYDFGHIILKENTKKQFEIIDGQQRITTALILVSAMFSFLHKIRKIVPHEEKIFERLMKSEMIYRLQLNGDDHLFFKDFVIDRIEKAVPKTISSNRIKAAFDFFNFQLESKTERELLAMIEIMQTAEIEVTFCN